TDDTVVLQTIDDAPPVGLCGSGLVDVVAQLYRRGLMDPTGRMRSADEVRGLVPDALASRLVNVEGVRAFVLATADETGGRPVVKGRRSDCSPTASARPPRRCRRASSTSNSQAARTSTTSSWASSASRPSTACPEHGRTSSVRSQYLGNARCCRPTSSAWLSS